MGNNFKAFYLHICYVIVSLILLLVIVSTAKITGPFLKLLPIRIIIIFLILTGYILIGTRLDISNNSKQDFLYGILILVVSIFFWIIAIYQSPGLQELSAGVTGSYWIFFNLYTAPMTVIHLLGSAKHSLILSLLSCFAPTVLIGVGIRIKRTLIERRLG